ncbi:hypothetical protein BCR39DRAFT_203398 [Naematelia encephala]|uniref:Uncharacterized protein n=1 Tax=Naematelia encephala TaxID=71784 RepID=A0A1Y2B0Z6_9TREE|nr:hypothetical protein BCR39DRAFT_203398 [Naematelia encephala]
MPINTPPPAQPPMRCLTLHTDRREPVASTSNAESNSVLSSRSVLWPLPLRLRGGCMDACSCCDDPVPIKRTESMHYTPSYRTNTRTSVPRGTDDGDDDIGFQRVKTRDSAKLSLEATLAKEELAAIARGRGEGSGGGLGGLGGVGGDGSESEEGGLASGQVGRPGTPV